MQKNITKILGLSVVMAVLLTPVLFLKAQGVQNRQKPLVPPTQRIENREMRFDERQDRRENRASTTEKRLENRAGDIERIRARIASTTASTSEKRMKKIENRFQKQQDLMAKVRERLVEKELKVTDVLGKIANKIQERISILEAKGLNMTAAKAKLAEASTKIEEITIEGENLANLIATEITDTNKESIFTGVKVSQDKIRTLARATHALLVDTIKEITKVLPAKTPRSATTTATSTI